MAVRPVTAPAAWGCCVHDWRDSAYRSDFVAEGKIGCGIEPMGAVISALIARPSYSAAMVTSVARTAGSVARSGEKRRGLARSRTSNLIASWGLEHFPIHVTQGSLAAQTMLKLPL
jgi:hypothetical protein